MEKVEVSMPKKAIDHLAGLPITIGLLIANYKLRIVAILAVYDKFLKPSAKIEVTSSHALGVLLLLALLNRDNYSKSKKDEIAKEGLSRIVSLFTLPVAVLVVVYISRFIV